MPSPSEARTVDLTGTGVAGMSPRLAGRLAVPAGDGPWPGLLVIMEIFGLDDVLDRHLQRLAGAGYLALAPDLYSDGGTRRCLVPTMRAMTSGQGRAYADLEAARQWLVASPDCTGRVGSIGFCMGGGFALMTADRGYAATSVNYGRLPGNGKYPDDDLDAALAGACPVVASYPGRDPSLRGAADRLERALTRQGVPHDVKEYPRAGHAFLNDAMNGPRPLRPLFRVMGIGPEPASAADAWRRIEAFLDEHLKP